MFPTTHASPAVSSGPWTVRMATTDVDKYVRRNKLHRRYARSNTGGSVSKEPNMPWVDWKLACGKIGGGTL